MAVVILFPTTTQNLPNIANMESGLTHWISFGIGLTIASTLIAIGFFMERIRWSKAVS
jgi:hypothetical protein